MNDLLNAAGFLWTVRRRMLQGEYSREPLHLLRLEWKGGTVDCDWMMRPADAWDKDLPRHLMEEHRTLQAFRDALQLRNMIFASFPEVDCADLRMFREGAAGEPVLVMAGTVYRRDEVLERVPSVVMQARLCGFRFSLEEGVFANMTPASAGCS
ncbi:MAG: hypothetical protein WBC92_13410 [Terracidiphilus sp.]